MIQYEWVCAIHGAVPHGVEAACPVCHEHTRKRERAVTLQDRARKLAVAFGHDCDRCGGTGAESGDPCPRCCGSGEIYEPCASDIADAMVSLARDFAREALRQVVKTKNGEWWKSEGYVWRVVSAVSPEGPASPAFRFPGDAEAAREQIIGAAIAAAEKGSTDE